jgi:hypothetical protein
MMSGMLGSFRPRILSMWFARALIALMVFSQASVALHACEPTTHGFGDTLAARSTPEDPASCHEEPQPPETRSNLCAAHCIASDLIGAVPQLSALEAPDIPLLRLTAVPASAGPDGSPRTRQNYGQTGPPPAIRFKVLRI